MAAGVSLAGQPWQEWLRRTWQHAKLRIERACDATGNGIPWWLPTWTTTATMLIAVAALVQRGRPELTSWLALALTLVPLLWWVVTARLLPMPVEVAVMSGVVLLFAAEPATPDLAPFLLMIRVAEVAALDTFPAASAAGMVAAGVFVGADLAGQLSNSALYVVGLVLSFDVGLTMRWYRRALTAEREQTAVARREARSEERRRIAREVHDVVGHSLSITLLHVTAARHALQQHSDIDDAVESLVEAERVGRSAMADVRRSVAVLGQAETAAPAPTLADIASLVDSSRAAGLDVSYDRDPSVTAPDVAGLELYRIVQESLANVAKHAPTAAVEVRLAGSATELRLSVRNSLPSVSDSASVGGLGVDGMAARARQMGGRLSAGPDGDTWLVDVVVPSDG